MSRFDPKESSEYVGEWKHHYKDAVTPEGRPARIHFSDGPFGAKVVANRKFTNHRSAGMFKPSIFAHPSEQELKDAEENALRGLDSYCNTIGVW